MELFSVTLRCLFSRHSAFLLPPYISHGKLHIRYERHQIAPGCFEDPFVEIPLDSEIPFLTEEGRAFVSRQD